MRHTRAIGDPAPSTDGASKSPAASYIAVVTNARSVVDAGAVEGAAGLASPGSSPAVPPIAFDVAAVLCGHNIHSEVGVENARHDYRVWDLVEQVRP